MRVLFVSEELPYPPINGPRIQVFYPLRSLAAHCEIHLMAFYDLDKRPSEDSIQYLRKYCSSIWLVARKPLSPNMVVTYILDRYPLAMRRYASGAGVLQRIVRDMQPDLVHCFGLNLSQFWNILQGVPSVLAPNDCPSRAWKRKARGKLIPLRRRFHYQFEIAKMQRMERELFPKFSRCHVVSEEDRQALAESMGTDPASIELVPVGVDIDYFAPGNEHGLPSESTLVMTGSFSTAIDVDGMLHFFNDVFPLIQEAAPDVHCMIVGGNPCTKIAALSEGRRDVVVTGYVPDLRPFLREASVYVYPIRIGTGMKNRILEALAMAKPVVTTPVGFEGLCLEPDKEIFVAATPELFANDVIRLLKDPQLRKDVGTAAREAVSRLYSWDSVTPRILAIYQSLMSRGSRRPI